MYIIYGEFSLIIFDLVLEGSYEYICAMYIIYGEFSLIIFDLVLEGSYEYILCIIINGEISLRGLPMFFAFFSHLLANRCGCAQGFKLRNFRL
jgi:hypothetical protein